VQRPGKFRWDYTPNSAGSKSGGQAKDAQLGQVLVADGRNLWFYDRELAQVTVKPVEAALSATPIMLLSGSSAQLHDSFEISGEGAHDGLDWVGVRPRSSEADFSHAALGFAGERLARMVVKDRLGQTVELDFSHTERNAHIDAKALQFVPPAGADVIGTPQG
jgi:outer membrane lipoprotein carrier protein